MVKYLRDRFRRMKDVLRHKKSFWKVEKEILGKNTFRGITHDLGKFLMYLMPIPTIWVRKFHKKFARHHNPKSIRDYREKLVDYECARFTKRKSTMNAYEYIKFKYSEDNLDYLILMWMIDKYKIKK